MPGAVRIIQAKENDARVKNYQQQTIMTLTSLLETSIWASGCPSLAIKVLSSMLLLGEINKKTMSKQPMPLTNKSDT